jgi:hypothetical protein
MPQVQRQNRKLLILFLIALLIALLPWVVLAQGMEVKWKIQIFVNQSVG